MVEQETFKKNLGEWQAVAEELERIVKETKAEYENAQELVRKGQIIFSQLELSVRILIRGFKDLNRTAK